MYADIIKKRKEELHFTTEELAIASGVPVGTINKILNGETRSPRCDTMQALDAALSKEKDKQDFVRETASYEGGRDDREYTLEDYYNLPDDVRVELIDGKLFYMESPSSTHQLALNDLLFQTLSFIRENHGTCVPFVAPMDVQLDCDNHTMLQPDFMIICDRSKIQEKKIYGAPDFVAEVASPSSSYKDGMVKLRKYINAGVREFWTVDRLTDRVISYFEGDGYIPHIYDNKDGIPVRMYDGKLKITFSEP